jgi:hypothetical protein
MTAYSVSNGEARELRRDENRTDRALKRGRTRRRNGPHDVLDDSHLRRLPIEADGGKVRATLPTDQSSQLRAAQHKVTVEHDPEGPPEWLRVSLTVLLIIFLAGASIAGLVNMAWNGAITHLIESQARAAVGIPWAGGASLVVVLILRTSFGTAEFKIFGVEFKGASGPTVMWLLCFLAEVLAMRVLW